MCDIDQAFQLLLAPSSSQGRNTLQNVFHPNWYSYENENRQQQQQLQQQQQQQQLLQQWQQQQQQQQKQYSMLKSLEQFPSSSSCMNQFSFMKWDIHILFLITLVCSFLNMLLLFILLSR